MVQEGFGIGMHTVRMLLCALSLGVSTSMQSKPNRNKSFASA